ncbi:MAG: 3-phosphoshikimate 1-carboxyvinyltransferase [Gemmatimonadaceae bacterium]
MKVRGTVRVPGDKSISHRALICASLATGESRVRGLLLSDDVLSTASVLRQLGVAMPDLSNDITVAGSGLRGFVAPRLALQCGNSGTTVRLIAGVAAAQSFESRFEGDASLSRRPMQRIAEPLTAMGASFEFDHEDGLPMTVHGGSLSGIAWNTRAASAQTKSAVLLAALAGGVQVSVRESGKSRDHTERMLASLGVPVATDNLTVTLAPVDVLPPIDISVPADPSSAAYLVALATLATTGEVRLPGVCVNPTRVGFIALLQRMGGRVRYVGREQGAGEDVATVVAAPATLRTARVRAGDVPAMIDELPLLGCVAAAAGIGLEVSGAAELRVKESDRVATLVSNLRAVGADAEERRDGFVIRPSSRALSGRVVTRGDHRIAMAFGVLSVLPGNSIEIDDRECVSVSYPGFWTDMASLQI